MLRSGRLVGIAATEVEIRVPTLFKLLVLRATFARRLLLAGKFVQTEHGTERLALLQCRTQPVRGLRAERARMVVAPRAPTEHRPLGGQRFETGLRRCETFAGTPRQRT